MKMIDLEEKLIVKLCLLLTITTFYGTTGHNDFDPPPHIIVFMVDDLGWNDVGFHGSNQIPTPNIDALAYNGIILNRHYSLPSGTPARAAFFTGMYPLKLGMQGSGIRGGEARGLPLSYKILPQYLHELGYETKLVGKWHIGYHTYKHTPTRRGFDSFFGFYNSHIGYHDYRFTQGNMSGYDMHRNDRPVYGVDGQYATDLFTAEALRIIDNHDKLRPLYLHISHLAPHTPLESPYDLNDNDEFQHIYDPNRKKYAKMVNRVDGSLGQIVTALADKEMLNNTVILFLSDNGAIPIGKERNSGSNWPLRGTKYTLYEGGVRTVAAIWSSRLREIPRVSNTLVHITDWLPTLYAAAGGDLRDLPELDGLNQLEILNAGRGPRVRHFAILNIDEVTGTEAAIVDRFKLVKGSLYNGFYDGIEGDSGRNPSPPQYNFTNIIHSAVAMAFLTSIGEAISPRSVIMTLRLQATVQCKPNTTFLDKYNLPSCNATACLFDFINDPCETENIARGNPKHLDEIKNLIDRYRNVLLKQERHTIDYEHADPRRHNYTWRPWLPYDSIYDYYPNAASTIGAFAICAHIGLVFFIIALRTLI